MAKEVLDVSLRQEDKKRENVDTIEKQWGESLMEKDYAEDHITLDSVIANAINRGPLRERYMVLRKDRSDTPTEKEKERFTYFIQHETRERWKNTFASGKNQGKIVEEYCNVSS